MNLLPKQETQGHPLKLTSDDVFRTGKLTVLWKAAVSLMEQNPSTCFKQKSSQNHKGQAHW